MVMSMTRDCGHEHDQVGGGDCEDALAIKGGCHVGLATVKGTRRHLTTRGTFDGKGGFVVVLPYALWEEGRLYKLLLKAPQST